jgi:hypothetical protein
VDVQHFSLNPPSAFHQNNSPFLMNLSKERD